MTDTPYYPFCFPYPTHMICYLPHPHQCVNTKSITSKWYKQSCSLHPQPITGIPLPAPQHWSRLPPSPYYESRMPSLAHNSCLQCSWYCTDLVVITSFAPHSRPKDTYLIPLPWRDLIKSLTTPAENNHATTGEKPYENMVAHDSRIGLRLHSWSNSKAINKKNHAQ